jgi:DNA modification methylase
VAPSHIIVVGHVLDRLRAMPSESVHMCVTSPPYYGLRSYGTEPQVWGGDPKWQCLKDGHEWGALERPKKGDRLPSFSMASNDALGAPEFAQGGAPLNGGNFCQRCGAWRGGLGLEPTVELYIEHMVAVFREVRRVLRRDGTLWLNIGDSYSAGGGYSPNAPSNLAGAKQTTQHSREYKGRAPTPGTKPKDLLMIPAQLALALRADGWWLRSEIVWAKRAPMPESCTDRPTSAHEKVFLFAKSGTPTFWTHRDHAGTRTKPAPDYRWQQTDDHGRVVAEQDFEPPGFRKDWPHWKRINLWDGHDYFYDAEAVKEESETGDPRSPHGAGQDSIGGRPASGTRLRPSVLKGGFGGKSANTDKPAFRAVRTTRNMRNVWHLGPEPFPEAHFATFVTEIPRRAILAGTSERGVCPKCGAPWVRRIESIFRTTRGSSVAGGQKGFDGQNGWAGYPTGVNDVTTTLGWRASCSCRQQQPGVGPGGDFIPDAIPATVLDHFLGAGTTLMVADRLGRSCVGIELNPEYARMSEGRLTRDVGPLIRGSIAIR